MAPSSFHLKPESWTAITNQSGASAQADAAGPRARPQAAPSAGNRYRVIDSYFANNRRLAGTGTGARLEYRDIDPSFLEMIGTTVTATPIELEHDSTKRTWLHPVAGSEAAKVGAGLFTKTPS